MSIRYANHRRSRRQSINDRYESSVYAVVCFVIGALLGLLLGAALL